MNTLSGFHLQFGEMVVYLLVADLELVVFYALARWRAG